MEIRSEVQQNVVADEVSALIAVVRPILQGILMSLKHEVVADQGGHSEIRLRTLARVRRPGDGDTGICFEYAVHDAIARGDAIVTERVADALNKCRVPGETLSSILFGVEKAGTQQLINTAAESLTNDSSLLYGTQGRPVKLKRHLGSAATAFRTRGRKSALPQSVSGLWKADLFLGTTDTDKWVGTSVKINRTHLEPVRGLRVGIVPAKQGDTDSIVKDERKNLMVCPLPYDGAFVETFYEAWILVVQFLEADAQVPKEVALPRPASRQVARILAERREFPVLDVIDALGPLAQPELLQTSETTASIVVPTKGAVGAATTSSVVAPIPLL
ncbi:hypothetical protein [Mycobacterium paraffinicum]|uniref:Uncharacterized protein n=1 Tax=Mycobacterium paraffinicum TaxID=53378 RepID=A0ABP8EZU3_9MYCO|nr:hypothetical protein [Mycobacterium paraffinicum]MCV7311798.1 hypothetical protein [Mycobacterium paraffinicum]